MSATSENEKVGRLVVWLDSSQDEQDNNNIDKFKAKRTIDGWWQRK
jgi:hypothetical protein